MPRRKKQSPGESLPKLTDRKGNVITEKQYGKSRRAFLDARAKKAGYKNYSEWQKQRRSTGVERKNKGRELSPTKRTETGQVYRFPFHTAKGNYTGGAYRQQSERVNKLVQRLIKKFPKDFINIFVKGNTYGLKEKPDRWEDLPWKSTGLVQCHQFYEYDLENGEFSTVEYLENTFQIEPIGNFPGIVEIQVTVWEKPKSNKR